jgi:V8-like Glu-specific endopeptidase
MNVSTRKWLSLCGALVLSGCGVEVDEAEGLQDSNIATTSNEIRGGAEVGAGLLEAVVRVGGGCSGTLITDTAVLTAGHCLCSSGDGLSSCATRSTVTFTQVRPASNSSTRADVTVNGTVVVHPRWEYGGWLTNDYAVIQLDRPASSDVLVAPIRVESLRPNVGDTLTLVGYGRVGDATGDTCTTSGSGVKRSVSMSVTGISTYAEVNAGSSLNFNHNYKGVCPGDSGGPALNGSGKVAGVCSTADMNTNSNYDPTSVAWAWLRNVACPAFNRNAPNAAFCNDALCPCWPTEGDCDGDAQCRVGRCLANIGPAVGLPAGYDACFRSEHAVTVFRDANYGGLSQSFAVGNWGSASLVNVGNDQVSSLKVPHGFVARLCSENGAWGDCSSFSGDAPSVGTFLNDRTSNIQVQPGVTLFDGALAGTKQTLTFGAHGASALNLIGNDRVSSLIAAPGVSVRLCAENGGSGDCQSYSGTVADVGALLNNRTSNVEVRAGVTVYRDAGFSGVSQTFVPGTYSASALNVVGNDQLSSLVVAPGFKVRLCSEAGGWGDCADFTGYVGSVGKTLNDRTSWLQITALAP